MNAAQIVRLARYNADLIKQSTSAAASVVDAEAYAWLNEANLRVERTLRAIQDDYFVKTMNSSTEITAQVILGISYTPSTSLKLAASTRAFTLPPDFLSLKSIRAVTTSYEDTLLSPEDFASDHFQGLLKETAEAGLGDTLYYDIVGEKTLYLAQPLSSALDIEIAYVARTKPLVTYSTGTLAITDATSAITGTTTVWLSGIPFDTSYLDIHFGTSASATVPTPDPSTLYDNVTRMRVAGITTDTAMTVHGTKEGTLAAGTGYLLASVPVVPEEFHYAMADYVAFRILTKLGSSRAKTFWDAFQSYLADAKTTASRRQVADIETVDSYLAEEWA